MFNSERPNAEESPKSKLSNEKYFSDLEKWLHEAYMWQGVAASFPYFLMCNQYIAQIPLNNDNLTQGLSNIPAQGHAAFQHHRNRVTIRNGKNSSILLL